MKKTINTKSRMYSPAHSRKLLIILLILFLTSCKVTYKDNPKFDSEVAYSYIEQQLAFGPRYPGSLGHENTQKLIQETLIENGWKVSVQETEYDGFLIKNIIGMTGEGSPWVILGAHYDTRRYADQSIDHSKRNEPVLGANDGGSGVGILLEISRSLANVAGKTIWLVFFDQEDNGNIDGRDWILGSRAFVDSLIEYPDQVVILDMVGDADLNIFYERNSDENLMDDIWKNASELGFSKYFIPEYRFSMIDDHTPFIRAGITAIDIIDFDYPYWHTLEDTLDKISKNSLEVVGSTILKWINSIGD